MDIHDALDGELDRDRHDDAKELPPVRNSKINTRAAEKDPREARRCPSFEWRRTAGRRAQTHLASLRD